MFHRVAPSKLVVIIFYIVRISIKDRFDVIVLFVSIIKMRHYQLSIKVPCSSPHTKNTAIEYDIGIVLQYLLSTRKSLLFMIVSMIAQ